MQRKRFVFAITCIFPMSILATTYYVNPNIKVSSLAKIDAAKYGKVKNLPLPNIFSALNSVQPGDSVLLAGGVHRYTQSINFTIDGTPDKPITFASYPGETAVLDFSAAPSAPFCVPCMWRVPPSIAFDFARTTCVSSIDR